jgi:hypothetical protein
MILTIKAAAALILLVMVVALVLYRVDESRTGNTSVPVITSRGSQLVRVVYHSSIANLLRRFTRGQLYAITFWNRVYVSRGYLVPSGLQHELEHVRQWHSLGPLGFPVRYVIGLFRHGYLKHPLEIAAREASGIAPWLR